MVSITSSSRNANDGIVDIEMSTETTDKKTDEPLPKETVQNDFGDHSNRNDKNKKKLEGFVQIS